VLPSPRVGLEALTWESVRPYEAGYEQLTGTARLALDPDHPANARIVDLPRAARGPDGLVRFDADVIWLRAPAPGTLLHVVANRGLVTGLPYTEVEWRLPDGTVDPGDGWLLERGMSFLWVGWQWDVARRPGAVGIEAPDALDGSGQPIAGQARLEFQPLVDTDARRLADEVLSFMGVFRALRARDLDDPTAVLTEREWFNGPRRVVPRAAWRFADHEHVVLDDGFRARRHYELTYVTSCCPVAGAGLAAVRDVVAEVKREYRATLTLGVSQSGRWLRQFLLDTANVDETGRRVFDGVHCHLAGGRRGEFNHRFAQPSTMNALGFTHLPPFSPEDGLLDGARAAGAAPRIFFTNTATEYWRGDASLVHPVPGGDEWRAYLYAGAHHTGRLAGYVESLPVQLPGNLVEFLWLARAHLVALEAWVLDGTDPPPSAVPWEHDGTGVTRHAVLESLAGLDGVELPAPEALLGMPPLDLGPDVAAGVGAFPPVVTGPARPCVVSAVDDDGNETAGVRLPEVAVPLGMSFGWNPERPRPGVPVEVWNLVGGRLPFSPEELRRRYRDRDGYLVRVRAVVEALVASRHLLAEDAAEVVRRAGDRFDEELTGPSAP